ncbi:thioester domain-containing protein [Streptomyces huiliensis]|uniref:thioester domain-containing protein n=1 Tax=Streptomyces huiliensis TaxID=2876027 RepID=UPI001CBF45BD|nr:thioester domain-containing protein [Streptomyces huiliensis]MBZ4319419.1 thioester domain-containing protein [Streptomyces huiliensis]
MSSATRRWPARSAAAVLAWAFAVVGAASAAGPAAAVEAPQHAGGVSAVLSGETTARSGAHVKKGGVSAPVTAGLFEMKVDGGGTVQTYCVDADTATVNGSKYREVSWGESSLQRNRNAGRIRWILQHSYPQVDDLAALAEKSGAGTLDPGLAAAGTQVAIWRYSDGADVRADHPAAQKLADYLYENAEDLAEPKASLSLDGLAVSGRSGGRIGPVTVRTTADSVSLTPTAEAVARNIRIVDKAGKPVTTTGNGGQLYFGVPAGTPAGMAGVTATANTQVPVGRVFTGDLVRTQTMILAGSSRSTATAGAVAAWADKGAAPAISARKNCAKGGVEITVGNRGDAPYAFRIAGAAHTVKPNTTETVLVKVAEDQAYRIDVSGPDGSAATFTGVLDCRTGLAAQAALEAKDAPAAGAQPTPPAPSGTPATPGASGGGSGSGGTGRDGTGGGTGGAAADRDLADTGGSGTTPAAVGVAAGLVLVGGVTVFLLRRRRAVASDASGE